MLHWFTDNRNNWHKLKLTNLRNDLGDAARIVQYFQDCGLRARVYEHLKAPTRLLNNPEADARLPRKKSLMRHLNYFRRNGQLEYLSLTTHQDVEPYLDDMFDMHIRRWHNTEIVSQFHDPRQKVFYRDLVRRAADQGWLLFSVLKFNGQPIAYHLGFVREEILTWYKPTFDPDFGKHSPGEVLLKYLLEYCLTNNIREFDFTIGDEKYKYRFSNLVRRTETVIVYRSRSIQLLDELIIRASRFARTALKQSAVIRRLHTLVRKRLR